MVLASFHDQITDKDLEEKAEADLVWPLPVLNLPQHWKHQQFSVSALRFATT